MPRRKTVTTVEEVAAANETKEAPPDEAIAQNERDALAALMQELSGVSSARVTVYRATRNQPQAYMFACSPEAFSLDDLRDKYNGGEFRIYISRDGKPWKNMRVTVEPKVQSAAPEAPSPISELAAAMREGFAQQAELLREALAARANVGPPAIDLNLLIQSLPQMLQAFRAVAAPPESPPAESKAIDMLLKGIELAKELRSEASDDGSLLSVVRDLIKSPLLARAIEASASVPPPASMPPPVISAAPKAPSPTTPQVSAFSPPTGEASMNQLTQYLALLCKKAATGSDPTLYADLILDNVPEFMIRSLLDRKPTAIDALIADYPPVAQHRAFFDELIAALREALDASDNDMLEPGRVSGSLHDSGNGAAAISGDDSPR